MLFLRMKKMCNVKLLKMKSLLKTLSLTFCIILLLNSKIEAQMQLFKLLVDDLKAEAQRRNPTPAQIFYDEFERLQANTKAKVQIKDSIHYFNLVDLCYWGIDTNINHFLITFKDSTRNPPLFIQFVLFIDNKVPEVFFRDGSWSIDSMHIVNAFSVEWYFSQSNHYGGISVLFSWEDLVYKKKLKNETDSLFTEKKYLQHGKGTLEIMDTIYAEFPEIYYPPQKIVFEF